MVRKPLIRLQSGSPGLFLGLVIAMLGCSEAQAPRAPQTALASAETSEAHGRENRNPQIRSLVLSPSEVKSGDTVALLLDSMDPDGDALRSTITWSVDGDPVSETSRSLRVPSGAESIQVTAIISDGEGGEATNSATLYVENSPPRVSEIRFHPNPLTIESPLSLKADGMDADGDDLVFQIEWSVDGETLDFTGTPLPTRFFERGSQIVAYVRADDGEAKGPALRSQSIEVANAVPRFTSSPDDLSGETTLRKTLRAEDPDGDRRLRFRLVEAPKGLDLDVVTGEIAWTPSPDQHGQHQVVVEVADGHGGSISQEFELSVGGTPPAALP